MQKAHPPKRGRADPRYHLNSSRAWRDPLISHWPATGTGQSRLPRYRADPGHAYLDEVRSGDSSGTIITRVAGRPASTVPVSLCGSARDSASINADLTFPIGNHTIARDSR